jgi:hypothetical protein
MHRPWMAATVVAVLWTRPLSATVPTYDGALERDAAVLR